MRPRLLVLIQRVLLGSFVLLAVSESAMAVSVNLGTQSAPTTLSVGNAFNSPFGQFYDNYFFSIPASSANSITSTISLGSVFGINSLETRLYSGTSINSGMPGGMLLATSSIFSGTGTGFDGTVAVISPITLGSGSYTLSVMGNVSGTSGGSYTGTLNISPVPEIAEWAMLVLGLGMMGLIAARRRGYVVAEYRIKRDGAKVMDTFINAFSWNETLARITIWSKARESRYVCICNVHSVVTASQDGEFRRVVNQADMATPDGMPVAWMLREQGFPGQERINGPDLMWKYCAQAERSGEIMYFYGSTDETLQLLSTKLLAAFPNLRIGGVYSPPFRVLSEAEDEATVASINASGAGVVFVGLGCPKQEKWMAAHRNRIHAVMIGVGAAFDYHAGTVQRAPLWMQRNGLEWLHRLCSEPRRLWKRYFVTNTIFVIGAAMQLLGNFWGNTPNVGEVAAR
jgi:N-acetylglucosaminyldiphosphoundecaprenol N-acetyl-beta-D-mannosaminyltransferase